MSKHDYTKHSKKNNKNKNANRPNPEVRPFVEEVKTVPEQVIEPVVEIVENVEPVENVETAKTVALHYGLVVNCAKLNIREQPNPYGNVLCTIPHGAKVSFDPKKSTWNFYKVCTEHGIEGYCMKKYIEVET